MWLLTFLNPGSVSVPNKYRTNNTYITQKSKLKGSGTAADDVATRLVACPKDQYNMDNMDFRLVLP